MANKTETVTIRMKSRDKEYFQRVYRKHPDCEDMSFNSFLLRMIKEGIDPPKEVW